MAILRPRYRCAPPGRVPRPVALAVLVLLLGLPAGCGRKAPPVARPATTAGGAASVILNTAPVRMVDPNVRTYQGRSPEQWGEQLAAQDAGARQQAATALRELGSAGVKPLVEGMSSRSPEVRLQALQGLSVPMVTENPKATLPVLLLLLRDPVPAVREQAALRLAWFDRTGAGQKLQAGVEAAQRIAALENVVRTDSDPAVRTAAANSLLCIRGAMSGKVGAD